MYKASIGAVSNTDLLKHVTFGKCTIESLEQSENAKALTEVQFGKSIDANE